MAKHSDRTLRIADQIQRELADLIRTEVKDPRVGMVTLTDVEVAQDYAHAKVFFTVMGEGVKYAESLEGLERAAGFLRHALAKRMMLRVVPQLHFVFDESVERGIHLSSLIDKANAPLPAKPTNADEKP
jgi:ribosome-binding factor A